MGGRTRCIPIHTITSPHTIIPLQPAHLHHIHPTTHTAAQQTPITLLSHVPSAHSRVPAGSRTPTREEDQLVGRSRVTLPAERSDARAEVRVQLHDGPFSTGAIQLHCAHRSRCGGERYVRALRTQRTENHRLPAGVRSTRLCRGRSRECR
jgi:hypothetical protein